MLCGEQPKIEPDFHEPPGRRSINDRTWKSGKTYIANGNCAPLWLALELKTEVNFLGNFRFSWKKRAAKQRFSSPRAITQNYRE